MRERQKEKPRGRHKGRLRAGADAKGRTGAQSLARPALRHRTQNNVTPLGQARAGQWRAQQVVAHCLKANPAKPTHHPQRTSRRAIPPPPARRDILSAQQRMAQLERPGRTIMPPPAKRPPGGGLKSLGEARGGVADRGHGRAFLGWGVQASAALDERGYVYLIPQMLEVRQTEIFANWLDGLRDRRAIARIDIRIRRLSLGHMGDAKSLGEGLSEMRIDHGPGYRLYFTRRAERIVILLCGGDKKRQSADIARARQLLKELADDN